MIHNRQTKYSLIEIQFNPYLWFRPFFKKNIVYPKRTLRLDISFFMMDIKLHKGGNIPDDMGAGTNETATRPDDKFNEVSLLIPEVQGRKSWGKRRSPYQIGNIWRSKKYSGCRIQCVSRHMYPV